MSESDMEFMYIHMDQIRPNPFQPREAFVKESLQELAESIKEGGVIQPIIVRKNGATFEIIAGERRWRAAQMAGRKRIPAIIKDVAENRVLIESLTENLHRLDLTDVEKENAIHELWENREELGFKSQAHLASLIGIPPYQISNILEAWEFRRKSKEAKDVSAETIRLTRGLKEQERERIIEKVTKDEIKASEVATVAKVVRKAPKSIKKELLKPKSRITPKMAESIVEKLPSEEEQEAVLKEAIQHRLTEDEVEARIVDIKRSREKGMEPIVDRQIIVEGQWIFDTLENPISRILDFNPKALSDLDNIQKNIMIDLLTDLKTKIEQMLVELGEDGNIIIDVEKEIIE